MIERFVQRCLILAAALAGAGAGADAAERSRAVLAERGAPVAAASGAAGVEDVNDIIVERLPERVKIAGFASDCQRAVDGDSLAAYRIGRRYLFGMGVKRSRQVGVAWMRLAAKLGNQQAKRVVGLVPRKWGQFQPNCNGSAGHGGRPRQFRTPPAEIIKLVDQIAPQYGLDPKLVMAVIQVESAFNSNAVSPKSAAGLMQLIPATARRFGVGDVFDPADNIHGGAKYLRWLLAYFQGNVTLALAAYNAGEGAVDRHKGIPPYRETQNYVRWVRQIYNTEIHRFDRAVTGPSPIMKQIADRGVETGG